MGAPERVAPAPPELATLLEGFHRVTGLCFRALLEREGAAVHESREPEGPERTVLHDSLDGGRSSRRSRRIPLGGGRVLALAFDGEGEVGEEAARLLGDWIEALLRREREIRLFSREMAERYEEITLLTSISETLGAHLHVRSAAEAVLRELAEALEARRAALWLDDEQADGVRLFAAHGAAAPDALDRERRVVHEVIERRRTLVPEAGAEAGRGARPGAAGEDARDADGPRRFAVPVRHAPPRGPSRDIGVLHLEAGPDRAPFRAGDMELVGAVGRQVAAAIQNGYLVEQSLQRERMLAELDIAHDLQLKLLPNLEGFSDLAEVAARCEPIESVGGDFYLLIRLSGGRLGVMLGDVSSHGMSAALIMALTMSAAAICARERERPADVLLEIHRQLVRELESTEMYMTLFYGVLDGAGTALRYANAGHAYAFRVDPDGGERLKALDPPVGMTPPAAYGEEEIPWRPGRDVLLLCTDGLAEGWLAGDGGGSEDALRTALGAFGGGPQAIVDGLFERAEEGGDTRDDRTALALGIRPRPGPSP